MKVRYDWGGQPSGEDEKIDGLIKVEERISWGARVMDADKQPLKVLATDRSKSWVVDVMGMPAQVDTSTLRPMKIARVLKKGDKVLAGSQTLVPGVASRGRERSRTEYERDFARREGASPG